MKKRNSIKKMIKKVFVTCANFPPVACHTFNEITLIFMLIRYCADKHTINIYLKRHIFGARYRIKGISRYDKTRNFI